jgi:hypothetical protein
MVTDPVCGMEIEEIDVPEASSQITKGRSTVFARTSAKVSSIRTGTGLHMRLRTLLGQGARPQTALQSDVLPQRSNSA